MLIKAYHFKPCFHGVYSSFIGEIGAIGLLKLFPGGDLLVVQLLLTFKFSFQIFLICQTCGGAEELHAIETSAALSKETQSAGFNIQNAVIEARGICRKCAA